MKKYEGYRRSCNILKIGNVECNINGTIYDYLGNCNFPKFNLLFFKNNTIHTRFYLRKAIFKISDFKDINKLYKEWEKIVHENKLAFNTYRELLLDEEMQIFSVNKFLKIMQIIEGIEREEITEEEQNKFYQHKSRILDLLKEEEDREFVQKWCVFNKGENFRRCLKDFTYFGQKVLSGLSIKQCKRYNETIIEKIKNDRDTYTHASHYTYPMLSDKEILDVNYIYKNFFRIKILSMLGIDNKLIRKRLYFDNIFEGHYQRLFQLKIKTDDIDIDDTGEFDKFMWCFLQVLFAESCKLKMQNVALCIFHSFAVPDFR